MITLEDLKKFKEINRDYNKSNKTTDIIYLNSKLENQQTKKPYKEDFIFGGKDIFEELAYTTQTEYATNNELNSFFYDKAFQQIERWRHQTQDPTPQDAITPQAPTIVFPTPIPNDYDLKRAQFKRFATREAIIIKQRY